MEKEVLKVTREFRDADNRERTLKSTVTVNTEEAAEKSAEVA